MPIICPSILAAHKKQYDSEMEKVSGFAHRIQIDLTDGIFARPLSISPDQAWWPVGIKADFHMMFDRPLEAIKTILDHKPNLIIVHAEADGDFKEVLSICNQHKIPLGVALLPKSAPEAIFSALGSVSHVLIFGGELGSYGGHADLSLLSKVKILKEKKPDLEIGWDGGVNNQNVSELINGGVDVLNVGGYLQKAEDPAKAFAGLQRIADETGTT